MFYLLSFPTMGMLYRYFSLAENSWSFLYCPLLQNLKNINGPLSVKLQVFQQTPILSLFEGNDSFTVPVPPTSRINHLPFNINANNTDIPTLP